MPTLQPRRPVPRARAPVQTLAVGRSIDESIARELGGFTGVRMAVNPTSSLMMTAGKSGRGKSSFWHSCPNAFIFNADKSSTPRKPRAIVWPGIRADGTPVEGNTNDPETATPIELTWAKLLEKRQQLIEVAKAGRRGPVETCILDTSDIAIKLCKVWMVEKHNVEHPENLKEVFEDIGVGGQYPELYSHILDFGLGLHNAGYGFCWVFHLGDKSMKPKGSTEYALYENVPLVYPNLWASIKAHCEVIAYFDLERVNDTVPTDIRDAKGKLVRRSSKTTSRTVCTMEFDPAVAGHDAKKRYFFLPDKLVLSRETPWDDYERAVASAIRQEEESDQ